ncbi:MFS transporter [Brochothrix thermosphacta]|uniref:MFS transporter n=1 Tax=Brochothrix thermosphacta TaxID=2756 RepID=UPI0039AF7CAF
MKSIKPIYSIVAGTFLFMIGFLLLILNKDNLIVFFIGSIIFGIIIGLVPPAILTLLTKDDRAVANIKIYNTTIGLASAFSPIVVEKLYGILVEGIYIIWFILGVILFLLSIKLLSNSTMKSVNLKKEVTTLKITAELLEYTQIFIILLLSSISYGAVITYLPIYLNAINCSIGLFYFIFWSAFILAQYVRKYSI